MAVVFPYRAAPWLLLALACSQPEAPPLPPPPSAAKVDQDVLDTAFHDCFLGDCERAYAHLLQIAPDSPARQTDAYRAVQYRHDADRLLRADVDPEFESRRAVYQVVADGKETESVLRLAARERLSRLGTASASGANEVVFNARADAPTPQAVAAAENAALLEQSKSKDPHVQGQLRAKLEPKIYSGKATRDDVIMLRSVCTSQKDAKCLHQLDRLILP